MNRKEIFKLQQQPSTHYQTVSEGVGLSRREFFKLGALGLTGFYFNQLNPSQVFAQGGGSADIKATARYCVFVHLVGAPSHLDTFDLKEGSWMPKDFNPISAGEIRWPSGLMPKLADQLSKVTLVRSMSAWALVHPLAQVWAQIGRNPVSGLSKIAPNIGSVVAAEFESNRQESQKLPGFIALNAGGTISREGYFDPKFAPFTVTPSTQGLNNASHPEGQDRFLRRYDALEQMDKPFRSENPLGKGPDVMSTVYQQGRGLMYDTTTQAIFQYGTDDSQKYGNTAFGNACLVARNIIKADAGTRFIQIDFGSWDHHTNIYNTQNGIYPMARTLDGGLGQLMTDLANTPSKSTPGKSLLDETLIVAMGEFGRTPGQLTGQQGRDHYLQMSAFFAGAGVRGNHVIGRTDDSGAGTVDFGWSREVLIRPEDVFCSIYSALGIDYTKVLYNDPFNRGFEYVPFAKYGTYVPINELW